GLIGGEGSVFFGRFLFHARMQRHAGHLFFKGHGWSGSCHWRVAEPEVAIGDRSGNQQPQDESKDELFHRCSPSPELYAEIREKLPKLPGLPKIAGIVDQEQFQCLQKAPVWTTSAISSRVLFSGFLMRFSLVRSVEPVKPPWCRTR